LYIQRERKTNKKNSFNGTREILSRFYFLVEHFPVEISPPAHTENSPPNSNDFSTFPANGCCFRQERRLRMYELFISNLRLTVHIKELGDHIKPVPSESWDMAHLKGNRFSGFE